MKLAMEAGVILRNGVPVGAFHTIQAARAEASRRSISDAYDLSGKRVNWTVALFTRADAGEEVM